MIDIREKILQKELQKEMDEQHELKMLADTYNTLYKTTIAMIDLDNLTKLDKLKEEMDKKISGLCQLEACEFEKHWA